MVVYYPKRADGMEELIMAIEKVRAYLKKFGMEDKIQEFAPGRFPQD